MSRFRGWTAKDVEKLGIKSIEIKSTKGTDILKTKNQKKTVDYVNKISIALDSFKIEYKREYKFLKNRKFRFDIAIIDYKIAIEFEGGIWSNGRHIRGQGYANDARKYNLATLEGWRLLRYTTDDTTIQNWEYKIAMEVQQLMGKRIYK